MTGRRDVIAGLACLGALGIAEYLRPRRPVRFLEGETKLTDLVPRSFGNWHQGGGEDIVLPRTEGTTASRIYGDQLARIYRNRETSDIVMLSIAYGAQQSDALQLHRPEACYPAVGFSVDASRPVTLQSSQGMAIPAVALTARQARRIEDIVYWSRVGSAFPQSASDQRRILFATSLAGDLPDGILVRASSVRLKPDMAKFAVVEQFLSEMLGSLPSPGRRALAAK